MNTAPEETLRETRQGAREAKFIADISLYPRLVEWVRQRLSPDGHGTGAHADEYSTATLYFETHDFDVYYRRGSYGRSKYRIRRYGASASVFLERKFRTERLLAKRRTRVPLDAIARLAAASPDPAWSGSWFQRRMALRRLHPLLQLSYDRVARLGQSPHGVVRVTIDRNLLALPLADFAFLPGVGQPFLEQACIVEVKYQVALPALFNELAGTFGSNVRLDVQRLSKFREALRSLDYPIEKEPDEQARRAGAEQSDPDPEGAYAD